MATPTGSRFTSRGSVEETRHAQNESVGGIAARSNRRSVTLKAINGWGIENRLHYTLDVSFAEDQCRVRKGYAAENFSRIRRIALNLLRPEASKKRGIKGKRLNASWDHDYLLKLLTG